MPNANVALPLQPGSWGTLNDYLATLGGGGGAGVAPGSCTLPATGSVLIGGRVTGDTNDRFQVDATGKMTWGSGAAVADTSLYRNATGTLALGTSAQAGRLRVFGGSSGDASLLARVTTDAQDRFYITAGGTHSWGDGTNPVDCTLFRNAAGELRTTDTGICSVRTGANALGYSSLVSGDAQRRFQLQANGQHVWGDGTNPADTVLYRRGAKEIGLNDSFFTVQRTLATDIGYRSLMLSGDVNARLNIDVSGTHFWGDGTNPVDVTLARGAANTLYLGTTSQKARLHIFGGAAGDITLSTLVTTDATPRFYVRADGMVLWGDGTAAQDVTLYRNSADRLQTDDSFTVKRTLVGDTALATFIGGDAQFRLLVQANGSLYWGSGAVAADVNIGRSAQNRLTLTGMLATTLGVSTIVKAGTPVDGDWATAPPDGTIVIDSSASKIWARIGGVWKSATLA